MERTEITQSFIQIAFNELSSGLLRVGGYKANRKEGYSPGILITLIFRVAKSPITANEFRIAATYDDFHTDIRTETILKKSKEERKPPKKYPAVTKGKKHN